MKWGEIVIKKTNGDCIIMTKKTERILDLCKDVNEQVNIISADELPDNIQKTLTKITKTWKKHSKLTITHDSGLDIYVIKQLGLVMLNKDGIKELLKNKDFDSVDMKHDEIWFVAK